VIRIMLGARERRPVPTSFTTRLLSFNEARARRPGNTMCPLSSMVLTWMLQ